MVSSRTILLVDDDKVDVMTVKRAVKKLNILNPIQVAANGEEAISYLSDPQQAMPGLILLDINMPRMNGIEFLKVREKNKSYKQIPVIMLTSSREDQDRLESFQHSIAGYMIKPVNFPQFLNMMETIKGYWSISEIAD
ncbi:MAG: response regulator [Bacteroidota bacterium]